MENCSSKQPCLANEIDLHTKMLTELNGKLDALLSQISGAADKAEVASTGGSAPCLKSAVIGNSNLLQSSIHTLDTITEIIVG